MNLTAPPTAPQPTDTATVFDARAYALAAWYATNVSELNALLATMTALAAGGAVSLQYIFSTTTTDSDPGAGKLRLDNATQNAATTIRADLADNAGSDLTNFLALLDDSTSTNKGLLTLRHATDATKWLSFKVASVASPSGYRNITVTNPFGSSATAFANGDALLFDFTPTGDKGDQGDPGPNPIQIATGGGTVDAVTATYTVPMTLTDKATCMCVFAGPNTLTNPSFAPDGLTPHTITARGGQPLALGDTGAAAGFVGIMEYNSANTRWELMNPVTSYLGLPQNSQSGAYGFVLADNGKHVYHPSADTSARVWTIPANASVPFPIGATLSGVNDTSAGVITLAITTDTLVWAGTGGTGSRAIAANGQFTAIKIAATRWMVSGVNIT